MKLLFAVRLARTDLLVAITRLASKVTSWNKSHNCALRCLMLYAQYAVDFELVIELSFDDLQTTILVMSPDADLAEDLKSSKRTFDLWLEMISADEKKCWPLAWKSKRHGPPRALYAKLKRSASRRR